jgi:hypothetical protein
MYCLPFIVSKCLGSHLIVYFFLIECPLPVLFCEKTHVGKPYELRVGWDSLFLCFEVGGETGLNLKGEGLIFKEVVV